MLWICNLDENLHYIIVEKFKTTIRRQLISLNCTHHNLLRDILLLHLGLQRCGACHFHQSGLHWNILQKQSPDYIVRRYRKWKIVTKLYITNNFTNYYRPLKIDTVNTFKFNMYWWKTCPNCIFWTSMAEHQCRHVVSTGPLDSKIALGPLTNSCISLWISLI